MPIRVPKGPAPKLAAEGPSDTDWMMALAQMDRLGRIPEKSMDPTPFDQRFRGFEPELLRRFDPTQQGPIDDRTEGADATQKALGNRALSTAILSKRLKDSTRGEP